MEKAEEIGDDLAARIGMRTGCPRQAPDAPTPPGGPGRTVSHVTTRIIIAFAPFGRYDLITVLE
jgi:hypothetical protein